MYEAATERTTVERRTDCVQYRDAFSVRMLFERRLIIPNKYPSYFNVCFFCWVEVMKSTNDTYCEFIPFFQPDFEVVKMIWREFISHMECVLRKFIRIHSQLLTKNSRVYAEETVSVVKCATSRPEQNTITLSFLFFHLLVFVRCKVMAISLILLFTVRFFIPHFSSSFFSSSLLHDSVERTRPNSLVYTP